MIRVPKISPLYDKNNLTPEEIMESVIPPEDKSSKPQISRLPVDALYRIALVFQWVINQGKYKADDWRKGVSWQSNYDSLQRHLMDYYKGQDTDPETGLETLAHAGCRLLMALEMQLKGTGTDDRYKG